MRRRDMALFAVPGLIWGSEWWIARGVDVPLLGALTLRYAVAALLLGSVAAIQGVKRPSVRQVAISAGTGAGFLAVPALLTNWASGRVSSGLPVVILSMAPLLAALFEGRAMGGLLAATVGGVAGTAMLASQGLSFSAAQWSGGGAALLAAASIAGSVVFVKRELADAPLLPLASIQLATGAACAALASALVEGRSALDWSWQSAAVEIILAIAGSVVALPLYYSLLRRMESAQLTASQWVATMAGLGESAFAAGSIPGWRMLGGAALLLAALWALLRYRPEDDAPVTLQSTVEP